jgi:hypothetical protein
MKQSTLFVIPHPSFLSASRGALDITGATPQNNETAPIV